MSSWADGRQEQRRKDATTSLPSAPLCLSLAQREEQRRAIGSWIFLLWSSLGKREKRQKEAIETIEAIVYRVRIVRVEAVCIGTDKSIDHVQARALFYLLLCILFSCLHHRVQKCKRPPFQYGVPPRPPRNPPRYPPRPLGAYPLPRPRPPRPRPRAPIKGTLVRFGVTLSGRPRNSDSLSTRA